MVDKMTNFLAICFTLSCQGYISKVSDPGNLFLKQLDQLNKFIYLQCLLMVAAHVFLQGVSTSETLDTQRAL